MKRRIRHGGDLQGGVICRRCNAKAVNLSGGEVRCGEIGAVISSAETSEAVKCSAPMRSIYSRPMATATNRNSGVAVKDKYNV